jgi:hypothetical protein
MLAISPDLRLRSVNCLGEAAFRLLALPGLDSLTEILLVTLYRGLDIPNRSLSGAIDTLLLLRQGEALLRRFINYGIRRGGEAALMS